MARVSTAQRKRIVEIKAALRRGKMLKAKRDGERAIPDKILKQLAALNLPPNPWVYDVCLRELLRGA